MATKPRPGLPKRKSTRLSGFDYSQPGAYFITLCSDGHFHLFGEIYSHVMYLNDYGQIVREEWFRSVKIRREIKLFPDEFVIMPNHLHGIVWIMDQDERNQQASLLPDRLVAEDKWVKKDEKPNRMFPKSLGAFVGGYKSAVTKRINLARCTPGAPVWQRNYHDHIVRNNEELERLRKYIQENPERWEKDVFYVES